jgi:hypothetical protein
MTILDTVSIYIDEIANIHDIPVEKIINDLDEKMAEHIVNQIENSLQSYINCFNIQTEEPDELKLIYHVAKTLDGFITPSYRYTLRMLMFFYLCDVLHQFCNDCDLLQKKTLSKIEHIIITDKETKNLGDYGLYLFFRGMINLCLCKNSSAKA